MRATPRALLMVLVPLALQGLAREVDHAVSVLLRSTLDLPDFVPQALSLVDPGRGGRARRGLGGRGLRRMGRTGRHPSARDRRALGRDASRGGGALLVPAPASRADAAGARCRWRSGPPTRTVSRCRSRSRRTGASPRTWRCWRRSSRGASRACACPRPVPRRCRSSRSWPTRSCRRHGPACGTAIRATSRRRCAWRWRSATGGRSTSRA